MSREQVKRRGPGQGKLPYGGLSRALNGAGAQTGAGAEGKKKTAPPRAVYRGRAGNWAGGALVSGPRRPCNEHYLYFGHDTSLQE